MKKRLFSFCTLCMTSIAVVFLPTHGGSSPVDPASLTRVGSASLMGSDAPFRTWTSRTGVTVEARLIKVENEEVTLETPAGNIMKIRLKALSPEDQRYLAGQVGPTSQPAPASDELRAQMDTWVVPGLELRSATLPEAAAKLSAALSEAVPEAQLRIRVDDTLKEQTVLTMNLRRITFANALRIFAEVGGVDYALLDNEVLFVARDDPRGESRRRRAVAPSTLPPVAEAPATLRFRFEVLPISERQERELWEMLIQRGSPPAFASHLDTTRRALQWLARQPGIRVVETIEVKTQSGLHMQERKQSGRLQIQAGCTPTISPDGTVAVTDIFFRIGDDEGLSVNVRSRCLFAGTSSQVLLVSDPDGAQTTERPRRRYAIRVTCEPIQ